MFSGRVSGWVSGKARAQMRKAKAADRVAPAPRYRAGRTQHKIAPAHFAVGDDKRRADPNPAAPQNDIKIERPRSPALSPALGARAAKAALNRLQAVEKFGRRQRAFHKARAVGVTPQGWANGRAVDDWPVRKKRQAVRVQRFERGCHDAARAADTGHARV